MITLMILALMTLALSWWYILFAMRKNAEKKPRKEPAWGNLVNDLKSISNSWINQKQLDNYIKTNQEKAREFETDYSFLVAYNSTIRQIKDRLADL